MDIQKFHLGSTNHLDEVLQETESRQSRAHLDIASTLSTNAIKRHAKRINKIDANNYEITLGRDLTAKQALRMLKASESNIYDIEYGEDIDQNDLINVSTNPLWSLNKSGNVLRIQRVK
jgi:hypothetical protein